MFTFHYVSINTDAIDGDIFVVIVFTFHYVSINTKLTNLDFNPVTLFTFHYVSINTYCGNMDLGGRVSLHSIMFLLIRGIAKKWDYDF